MRRPDLPTGGFPFEFANDNYPDVDDTAVVVLALRRAADGDAARPAADRGLAWALGMQSRGGGWGAFDADNTSALPLKLPFCDFGAVTDPPSADVTAHMLELLGHDGLAADAAPRAAGSTTCCASRSATARGSAAGAPTTSTAPAPPSRRSPRAASSEHPSVGRAVDWLNRVQNADGGFGEDLRSYRDASWRGRGESTASQTAWALLAYHAAGEVGPRGASARCGGSSRRSGRTAAGTSRSTRAPASRATST